MLGSAPGIGRYIELLTQELFELDHENEYVVFLREPAFSVYRKTRLKNVRAVLAPERWYSVSEQVTWPLRIARERLGLLFVPQFNVPLLVPCPFVVTVHDVTQLHDPGALQRRSRLHRAAFKLIYRQAVERARAVIAVSHYTASEVMQHFSPDPDRLNVIYEGPGLLPQDMEHGTWNTNSTTQDSGSLIQDPRLRPASDGQAGSMIHGRYLLAVGVWRPHKNFVGLLEAFKKLRERHETFSDINLVLVGEEDPRYPEVRAAMTRLSLLDSVFATGVVSDVVLDRYYRRARGVVVPSFFEGFGFVGLEALKRNVPVAASNAAALPEILGDAALYFDPADTDDLAQVLARLLGDEAERRRILNAAPKILARYSWKVAATQTLSVLNAAARKP